MKKHNKATTAYTHGYLLSKIVTLKRQNTLFVEEKNFQFLGMLEHLSRIHDYNDFDQNCFCLLDI